MHNWSSSLRRWASSCALGRCLSSHLSVERGTSMVSRTWKCIKNKILNSIRFHLFVLVSSSFIIQALSCGVVRGAGTVGSLTIVCWKPIFTVFCSYTCLRLRKGISHRKRSRQKIIWRDWRISAEPATQGELWGCPYTSVMCLDVFCKNFVSFFISIIFLHFFSAYTVFLLHFHFIVLYKI